MPPTIRNDIYKWDLAGSRSNGLKLLPNSECQRLVAIEERFKVENMTLSFIIDEPNLSLTQRPSSLRAGVSGDDPKEVYIR